MRLKLVITAIVLGWGLQIYSQERVYMPFFEVMNMHRDYQYSTSRLFKTYVDNNNKYILILPDRSDTLPSDKSDEKVRKRASELNCPFYITGALNRLGDVVIITISMYNTGDGKKVWQSILKAHSPDDLDPIMEKVAVTINNKQSKEGDIYNVTEYDARQLKKIGANRFFGVTIGGGYTFVNNINKNFPAGFGIQGSYDMRNVIFNIKAEAYFSDSKVYYFDIDAIYPFTSRKSSPFISGGMGYGGVTLVTSGPQPTGIYIGNPNSHSEGGLILFAGCGYLLNRNSDVSLRFAGNVYAPLFKVENVMPVGILFTTTLLFGK